MQLLTTDSSKEKKEGDIKATLKLGEPRDSHMTIKVWSKMTFETQEEYTNVKLQGGDYIAVLYFGKEISYFPINKTLNMTLRNSLNIIKQHNPYTVYISFTNPFFFG